MSLFARCQCQCCTGREHNLKVKNNSSLIHCTALHCTSSIPLSPNSPNSNYPVTRGGGHRARAKYCRSGHGMFFFFLVQITVTDCLSRKSNPRRDSPTARPPARPTEWELFVLPSGCLHGVTSYQLTCSTHSASYRRRESITTPQSPGPKPAEQRPRHKMYVCIPTYIVHSSMRTKSIPRQGHSPCEMDSQRGAQGTAVGSTE